MNDSKSAVPVRTGTSNLADTAAQFGSTVIGRGAYMLLQVVLARELGPESFGIYAIGWTVLGLASTVAPIGMPQATLRFEIGGRASMFKTPMVVTTVLGLVGAFAIWAGADLLANHVFAEPNAAPVIRSFAPSLPLLGISAVMMSALRVSRAMMSAALLGALLFIFYLVTTLFAFTGGASATTAAATYGLSIGLTIIPSAMLLWSIRSPAFMSPSLGPLIHFGLITMTIHSSNVLNLWADRLIIGIMAEPKVLAMYQVASQLAMIVIVLRSAVTTIFESSVPKLGVGGRPPDITREFVAAYRLLLHVCAPGLVVLSMTSAGFITLLFGPAYLAATVPLTLLVIGQLLLTLTGPSVPALHMTGDERRVMTLTVGTCALNIAGNVALIPFLGSTGAALATLVANSIVGVTCFSRLIRTGRIRFSTLWVRDILLGIAVCIGIVGVGSLMCNYLSVYVITAMLVVSYAGYALILCLFCRVEDELIGFLRVTIRRILCRPVSI